MTTTATARVYVGTYSKYNSGSIEGEWLDLEDYTDKEAFLAACADLHKDEADPELMFQDYEGIPEGMVGESFIKDEVWEWLELDEDDRELIAVYRAEVDSDGSLESAQEAFAGKYDSEEDWAREFMDSTGGLDAIPENLRYYFDYEAYARDADIHFVNHEGAVWAFLNH